MSRSVNASRMIGLLVLSMAALVVLVAALGAPEAEAKKKKKPFPFNVVQCPTQSNDTNCLGTEVNDFLIGGPEDREFGAFDFIEGREGTDVYNGGDGADVLFDSIPTSSDVYLFPSTEFSGASEVRMRDEGGAGDVVGLSSYGIDDFEVSRNGSLLVLDGPNNRDIKINFFFDGENFGKGKIEYFLFREGLVSGDEVTSEATAQATPEEQAALKERLPEDERSDQGVDSQESKPSEQPDAAGFRPQTK